ncbi:cytochrome bd-II oxidase subunit 2 [Halolamina pelagica]|uniref:Cytochrome bd-II oxidase subunit 2 n=1 Tax=Halolamina pelagica TaxID=699431 RepID=A0A0P7HQN7_9EURY|nr:cytochrome bd-II oxidase subunit 2 [Halolamina pelagica]
MFPVVYGNLFSRHYLLMFAILGSLILRGLAPEMYEQRHDRQWQRYWGWAFVGGSLAAPFTLGVFVGNWLFGVDGLASAASVTIGLAVVALTVVDGAAFLGLKTRGTSGGRPASTATSHRSPISCSQSAASHSAARCLTSPLPRRRRSRCSGALSCSP